MSSIQKLGSLFRSEMHKVSQYNIGFGNTALAQITSGNGLKIDGLDYTIPHSDYLISKSCAEALTPGKRVLVAFFNDEPIVVDIVGQNLKKHDHNGVYSTVSDFNNLSKAVENIGTQQQAQGGLIGETSQFISSLADNVVQQGTSGEWTYRKWSSGIAECWMTSESAVRTFGSDSYHGMYVSNQGHYYSFPKGLFVENASVSVTFSNEEYNGGYGAPFAIVRAGNNWGVDIVLLDYSGSDRKGYFSIIAKGRWK